MARKPFLQEIKVFRVQSEDPDLDEPRIGSERGREKRYIRTTGSQWRNRRSQIQSWKRRSSSRSSSKLRKTDHDDPASKSATLASLGSALDNRQRRKSEGGVLEQTDREILYDGMLHKTTRTKITSDLRRTQHEHRQYRKFQLTEHSLEYSQLLQRVCHSLFIKLHVSWYNLYN